MFLSILALIRPQVPASVPPSRHSHAILTLPPLHLHAAPTPPPTAAPRSYAVPMPPQRCCNAASMPPPRRRNAAQRHGNTALTPLPAVLTPPRAAPAAVGPLK